MKLFQDILKAFREQSITEKEKGGKFEQLMKGYLLTSPIYASTLKKVWLWNEFPYKSQFGGKDLGIDLVALSYVGGYIGESTRSEIEYAERNGRMVNYLEPVK